MRNECLEYADAVVHIYFPDKRVACQFCPLLETYARKQCRRTGEYIIDDRGQGMWCPLEIKEEISSGDPCSDPG